MTPKSEHHGGTQGNVRKMCVTLLIFSGLTATGHALPPTEPLPEPLFSFDGESPSVVSGHVLPDGILRLDFPHPVILIRAEELGLGLEGDELDAISLANTSFPSYAQFALLFSVDTGSVGVALPDPDLVAAGVPYNASDQALRGHAAGDQFMSTMLFLRGSLGRTASEPISNNVLVRNNFDEGGVDFVAAPPTSAAHTVQNESQDCVDATLTATEPTAVYFTASATSPSLESLPGSIEPSGAHVFYVSIAGRSAGLFASFTALGLVQEDDIDALLVFDTDGNGEFNGTDEVLFSLASNSPSLETISGVSSSGGAADVFSVTFGGLPTVFASAGNLGLGHPDDNIDALDYWPCNDADACATLHGIRAADIPTLSGPGIVVMTLLLLAAGTIIVTRARQRSHRLVANRTRGT